MHLVQLSANSEEIKGPQYHKDTASEVRFTIPLTEQMLRGLFPANGSGGPFLAHTSHWDAVGKHLIGVTVTLKRNKHAPEFIEFGGRIPEIALAGITRQGSKEKVLVDALTPLFKNHLSPFYQKPVARLLAERDIRPEGRSDTIKSIPMGLEQPMQSRE